MKNVAVILANGFEEMEAMSILDILRRGGVNAVAVALEELDVAGAHQVKVQADIKFDDVNFSEFNMIVLPGGLPGAEYLAKSVKLQKVLQEFDKSGKKLGAICAAPWALGTAGVLKNAYTCYPGFEATVAKAGYNPNQNVLRDENIITSKGPATAMEFALEILRDLAGEVVYSEVKSGLLF
ncbi:DJ-1/PfpI family protein [Campylobacter iguaniorum]|nr:DJ-1 family glyoxalase III [Campylobacter iguaniorum]ALV24971.1 DJ-1/PfpI family protein [Campylobacter iguaniorum]